MSCMPECFLLSVTAQEQHPSPCFSPLLSHSGRDHSVCHSVPPSALMRSHSWVWQAGEHRQTRAALAIAAHRLLEREAADSSTGLGHGSSAGAGWNRVGREVPAEHLAQAVGQEPGKSWFRKMPAQCLCLE